MSEGVHQGRGNGSRFLVRKSVISHSSSTDIDKAISDVEHDCLLLVEWFRDNYMTLNASKCHLLVSGYKDELMFATVGDALIWEEVSAKLLGIIIDSSLTFNDHVEMICKKASQKVTEISRMLNFMSDIKKKFDMYIFWISIQLLSIDMYVLQQILEL